MGFFILIISMIIIILFICLLTMQFNISINSDEPDTVYADIEYSEKLMAFLKQFTMEISVLKARNFFEGRDTNKITQVQVQNLISDVATEVNSCLVYQSIEYERLLYSKQFIDKYIIDITINALDSYLKKEMIETT